VTSTSLLVGMSAPLRLSSVIHATIRRAIPIALPCCDRRTMMYLNRRHVIKKKINIPDRFRHLINIQSSIINVDDRRFVM